ncbi:MAG TPA: carbon-nitrogen hydrolase family protein [Rhodospirillales bacterium]|nr:carbon-nitrogen hydrolase family protein [Rhodospirillales bacterium]
MANDIKYKLAVVQMDCVVGEIAPNVRKIEKFAQAASDQGVDLVVFPECATTGYFIADDLARLAEPSDGPTDLALGKIAASTGVHMAVGTVVAENSGFYDSQVLFAPTGERLSTYHKVHLFSAERGTFQAGDTPTVIDTELGRVGMTICYDMIFGDYFRCLAEKGADIIINSTDWIGDGYQRQTWGWSGVTTQGMAATRALENGVFVAMSNRVGHEMGFDSLGYSCIASPSGQILASISAGEDIAIADVDIKAEDLDKWRVIATYHQDRRPEIYV